MAEGAEEELEELRSSERMVFFTDAVVAIALTLLILPLLESVSDAGDGMSTHEWVSEHAAQLGSFALSFVVIASFWLGHHSLYRHVRRLAPWVMQLNLVWMFAIVWLPVATAMVGSMPTDALQLVLYVGAMVLASLASVAVNLVVLRHPETWEPDDPPTTDDLASALATFVLFVLALVVALVIGGGRSYSAMFLLLLAGPTQSVLARLLRRRSTP